MSAAAVWEQTKRRRQNSRSEVKNMTLGRQPLGRQSDWGALFDEMLLAVGCWLELVQATAQSSVEERMKNKQQLKRERELTESEDGGRNADRTEPQSVRRKRSREER